METANVLFLCTANSARSVMAEALERALLPTACPLWPGHPVTAHWGIDDPAAGEGTHDERMRAFQQAFLTLEERVKRFVALPTATAVGSSE